MASSNNGQPTLAKICAQLLESTIKNILHELVIYRHKDHKQMIMGLNRETKLPHCEKCGLARQLDPPLANKVRGAHGDPPKDIVYCDRKPWCRTPGFDIYGNPFPRADVTGRPPTKKEREAAKNRKENENTPASAEAAEHNGTVPPSPSADGDHTPVKLEKGEKKASKIDEKLKKGEYVPWQTCPSCKRSLLVTRFAKHLEQCMGLSGRAASRNAMAKINGATPAGSRGGTPGPLLDGKDDDDDDDGKIKGSGAVRKQVLKKGMKEKLKKDKAVNASILTAATNGKLKAANAKNKVLHERSSPPPSSTTGEGKRDRDDADDGEDDESVHLKKRQKLQRVGSQVSAASQSTAAPLSAVDLERGESQDGSFADDGVSLEAEE